MAATYTNNWINEDRKPTEQAVKVAEKAEKIEKRRMKEGWRWLRLSPRTKVFVPCDSDGNPTADGERIIMEARKTCI